MTAIHIEWLSDSFDCECCGGSWAEGAKVFFDGEKVLDLRPVAHCFGGANWHEREVSQLILEKLGHTLTTD